MTAMEVKQSLGNASNQIAYPNPQDPVFNETYERAIKIREQFPQSEPLFLVKQFGMSDTAYFAIVEASQIVDGDAGESGYYQLNEVVAVVTDPEKEKQTITSEEVGSLEEVLGDVENLG